MLDLDFKYQELINTLTEVIPFKPEIGLILGSGLGEFAGETTIVKTIPTNKLPEYPESTVERMGSTVPRSKQCPGHHVTSFPDCGAGDSLCLARRHVW